jgi:hypothetical protein
MDRALIPFIAVGFVTGGISFLAAIICGQLLRVMGVDPVVAAGATLATFCVCFAALIWAHNS